MSFWKKGKFMKSVLATLIVLAFILSGCTSNKNNQSSESSVAQPSTNSESSVERSPSELPQVKLSWYYATSAAQPNQKEVEDAVNQYLKENTKLNATVELVPYDFGSYDQKMNVKIAAGEPFDIVFTTQSWLLQYPSNVSKGAFLALDDLMPEYAPKTFKEMMPEKFWEDVRYSGDHKIYAIPNYQIVGTASGFVFRKDLVDKYHFDIATVKKTADLEPYLKLLKENEPNIIPMAFNYNPDFDMDYRFTGGIWFNKNNPYTPVDILKTPEKMAYWNLMHKWYGNGYIYKDLANVKDFNALLSKGNVAVTTDSAFKPGGDIEFKKLFGGFDVVRQQITDVAFGGVNGTMNAISSTSKNPERALMFLELVNNDKVLYDLLCYGIKGKHYNEVDGYYQPIEGSGYNPQIDWVFGNQLNGLPREGQPKDVWEQTKKLNNEVQLSPLFGFNANLESLKSEQAAISAVNDEYAKMLDLGVADPEKIVPKYLAALEKAGQNKLYAEVRRQFDEWLVSKGKK